MDNIKSYSLRRIRDGKFASKTKAFTCKSALVDDAYVVETEAEINALMTELSLNPDDYLVVSFPRR